MKLINESVWSFKTTQWGAIATLLASIAVLVLQFLLDGKFLNETWTPIATAVIVLISTMLGKKVYQPELHIATNQSQIKAFASVLPSVKPKFFLGSRSITRLKGVHPDLVKVVKRAIQITECDFTVIEGVRTKARQAELVKTGASQTFNSRHLTGHAIDLAAWVNGTVSWDWKYYYQIEKAMKQAAQELNVSIEWGGDWRKFKDGPHWQLPWSKYPS